MSHCKGVAEAKTGKSYKESNLRQCQQFVPEIWRLEGLRRVKRKASYSFKRTATFERLLGGTPL